MEFVGRELELQILEKAWNKTRQNDPQLVVLLADSGYGKTRLVHEFYHKISTRYDPTGYWPDYLGSNELDSGDTSLDVNPTFSSDIPATSSIPWLWWGARWKSRERNHINFTIYSEVDKLLPHFDPIIKARNDQQLIKNVFMNVGKTLLGVAGGDILDHLVATGGLIKEIFDNRKDQPSQLNISDRQEEERQSMVDKLLDFFRVVLNDKENSMPVILFLDDAQWMDETGREFVERLLTEATNKNWPIMIIATHWEREWFLAENDQESFSGLVTQLRTPILPDIWQPIQIGKLTEVSALLKTTFPGLTEQGHEKVISKVDGNPLYLEQIILELKSDKEYFEENDFNKPLSEYGHEELTEVLQTDIYGLFRKRFRKLNRNQRYLLGLGSIQGLTFFDQVIARAACQGVKQKDIGKEPDAINLLWQAASPENITAKSNRASLSEFRHKLFYDLARDNLKNEEEIVPELIKASLDWYEHRDREKESVRTSDLSFLRQWIINQTEQVELSFLTNEQLTILGTICTDEASLAGDEYKFFKAEKFNLRGLALYKKSLGDEHPDVATSLNNLAVLYWVQGDYVAAKPLYQESLALRKKLLGEEHSDVATSLNNLAELYRMQGDYSTAEPLYQKSLALRKKLLGDEHPDVATSLNNLAELYRMQGDYSTAEPLYQKSLALRKKLLGDEHPDVAISLNNMAVFYQVQGDYAAVEPLLKKSLAIQKSLLGEVHLDVAGSLNNLAEYYRVQGRYTLAEPLYRESLTILRQVLGSKKHPNMAVSLNNLALLYQAQRKYVAAEKLYRESLMIQRHLLGEKHSEIALCLNNLAVLYRVQGNYEAAEPMYKESLMMRRSLLGDEHPDVAVSLNNLAVLYRVQGNYESAVPLLEECLVLSTELLGEEHPNVLSCKSILSEVQEKLKKK